MISFCEIKTMENTLINVINTFDEIYNLPSTLQYMYTKLFIYTSGLIYAQKIISPTYIIIYNIRKKLIVIRIN